MSSIEALICGRGLLQLVDISIKLVLEVAPKLVENKVAIMTLAVMAMKL
ncbi:hypothetical protein Hanom_Chr16g01480391 [Helianthus anomalus]